MNTPNEHNPSIHAPQREESMPRSNDCKTEMKVFYFER